MRPGNGRRGVGPGCSDEGPGGSDAQTQRPQGSGKQWRTSKTRRNRKKRAQRRRETCQLRPETQTANKLVEFRDVTRGKGGGDGPEQSSARLQRQQGCAEHGGSKEQQKREKNRQFQEKPAEAEPTASRATRKQQKARILAKSGRQRGAKKAPLRPTETGRPA